MTKFGHAIEPVLQSSLSDLGAAEKKLQLAGSLLRMRSGGFKFIPLERVAEANGQTGLDQGRSECSWG